MQNEVLLTSLDMNNILNSHNMQRMILTISLGERNVISDCNVG